MDVGTVLMAVFFLIQLLNIWMISATERGTTE